MRDYLQIILDAAERHGHESDPEHEVGDLQTALMRTWDRLSAVDRRRVFTELRDDDHWVQQVTNEHLEDEYMRRKACILTDDSGHVQHIGPIVRIETDEYLDEGTVGLYLEGQNSPVICTWADLSPVTE